MLGVAMLGVAPSSAAGAAPGSAARGCTGWGRPAIAADPRPHALRVFAIQFEQQPGGDAHRRRLPARGRLRDPRRGPPPPGSRPAQPGRVRRGRRPGDDRHRATRDGGAGAARAGRPACAGQASPCATLAALGAINAGYAPALDYLGARYPKLGAALGRSFVAATDEFVRVFMTTMAAEARRYRIYVIASNTQARFRVSRSRRRSRPWPIRALLGRGRSTRPPPASPTTRPSCGARGCCTATGPRRSQNLIADNYKVPLTAFEQALGFAPGPVRGTAALANLRPVRIPGTGARLGLATSLPAFQYGPSRGHSRLRQRRRHLHAVPELPGSQRASFRPTPTTASGPVSMETSSGSRSRGWARPTGRSAIPASASPTLSTRSWSATSRTRPSTVRARSSSGAASAAAAHYIGNQRFVSGQDLPRYRRYAGRKPQFLALAPWVASGSRSRLRGVGQALATGSGGVRYVQTAVIADLPFPADRNRPGCLVAGR